jgi:uncharacterized coiled-coil protein SlyX
MTPMSDEKGSDEKNGHENKLADRIDALEIRLTFQDETIEALNQTITAQWLKIDALTRRIESLSERLQQAEDNAPGPANEPPPHY